VTALARASSSFTGKLQTHPVVREDSPQEENCKCLTVIKIWSWFPDGCPAQRQTGGLIVGQKITSASISISRMKCKTDMTLD
jgi:hypothetical protein